MNHCPFAASSADDARSRGGDGAARAGLVRAVASQARGTANYWPSLLPYGVDTAVDFAVNQLYVSSVVVLVISSMQYIRRLLTGRSAT